MTNSRQARTLAIALRLLISAGLLALLLSSIPAERLWPRLAKLDMAPLCLALLLAITSNLLSAWRWHRIVTAWRPILRWQAAGRHYFIGQAFNQVLPGATLSGDAYRAAVLRDAGMGWRAALTTVLLDRLSGLLVLGLLTGLGLAWLPAGLLPPALPTGAMAAAITLLVMAFSLVLLQRAKAVGTLPPELSAGMLLISSLLVQAAAIASFLAALAATGTQASGVIIILLPLIFIATALPISVAGWGTREAAAVLVLGWAHVDPAAALAASLVCGSCALVQGLAAIPLLMRHAPASASPDKETSS